MFDLFRLDAEQHVAELTEGLLALERTPNASERLEACMRAAHSLKGAARIVGLASGVSIAHAIEDCLVAVQQGRFPLEAGTIDILLRGVDLLKQFSMAADPASLAEPSAERPPEIDRFVAELSVALEDAVARGIIGHVPEVARGPRDDAAPTRDGSDRALRVSAEQLNRLLGAASESLIESRWLKPFAGSLLRLKRQHHDAAKALDGLREVLPAGDARAQAAFADVRRKVLELNVVLTDRLDELETFDRRSANVAHRLYDEALAARMRPFSDAVTGFPRVVRDLARTLDKRVRLEVVGATTLLDRDILDRLDATLGHLLRNAMDHGIESAEQRTAAGKPAEAVITFEASRRANTLQIVISDDGRGIDVERVRARVIERKLTSATVASELSEAELFEFLFVPSFSTKDDVTDISGRGVGLDVVQNMLRDVRGSIKVTSRAGQGTRFQLQLPLSLSVVRALLVEIGGEPYAFPLAYIVRTLKLRKDAIRSVEGRQLFLFEGRHIGLVDAGDVLLGLAAQHPGEELAVIVIGAGEGLYGIVVHRFLGERDLALQPLDVRLGKIGNVAGGALMEDGAPALVVDVDDLIRSVETRVASGELGALRQRDDLKHNKRVLVVDDSLTVRELERKLLSNAGYDVEIAVNGMDGWNAVRAARFDLVVTDVDMPRMDGIELVASIKNDQRLKSLPVIIVSYKDREEDRLRGLGAGADYFLSKGSFHDETLLQAVVDLIGEAAA